MLSRADGRRAHVDLSAGSGGVLIVEDELNEIGEVSLDQSIALSRM